MPGKVLIVDDDEITHLINKRLIKNTSFADEVIVFWNGHEAIDYFKNLTENDLKKEQIPEIIFLDLNMPVMNGWEFLEEFTNLYYKKFPYIRIYILSSSNNPEEIEKSKNFPPVQDYYIKPLSKENLESLM